MVINVGELRSQAAYGDARAPVLLIVKDEELATLLEGRVLVVTRFYPDGTDASHNHIPGGTFKIEVAIARAPEQPDRA